MADLRHGCALILPAVVLGGCAPALPQPMTAADIARLDSGEALVAYLSQPDADASVCDRRAAGPHLARMGSETSTALVRGMAAGRINPELWRRCADGALDGATPQESSALVEAVARSYQSLVEDSELEKSPVLQARLAALRDFYAERPSSADGRPEVMASILRDIYKPFAAHRLPSVASAFASQLLDLADLERGRYGGVPVDAATLDSLYARGDQRLLRWFADRLPSADLRVEARRRMIRLTIAASPYPEVRANAAEVEEAVLNQGLNRISFADHPIARAWLDRNKIPLRGVLIRQDVWHQVATLIGYWHGRTSGLPAVSLQGVLWVEAAGLSRPISVCRSPQMLDPSPCFVPADAKVDGSLSYLDSDGAFHIVDHLRPRAVARFVGDNHAFTFSMSVAGAPAGAFTWPYRFERPDDLVFSGSGNGPPLEVAVDVTNKSFLSFEVSSGGRASYAVLLERADLRSFHIVSRGGAGVSGTDGFDGMDGTSGMDGSSASCPSSAGGDGSRGGDGTSGSPGGSGGPGGDGGDIDVKVDCGPTGCAADIIASLRSVVRSEGGAGGYGGKGGRGGHGGRGGFGGSGTFCSDPNGGAGSWLSGGSSGASGSDGWNGTDGSNGPPGRAGEVRITVARATPRS